MSSRRWFQEHSHRVRIRRTAKSSPLLGCIHQAVYCAPGTAGARIAAWRLLPRPQPSVTIRSCIRLSGGIVFGWLVLFWVICTLFGGRTRTPSPFVAPIRSARCLSDCLGLRAVVQCGPMRHAYFVISPIAIAECPYVNRVRSNDMSGCLCLCWSVRPSVCLATDAETQK